MAGGARGELRPPNEVMLPRSRMVGRRPTRSFKPAGAIFPMHISPVPHPTIPGMHVVVPAACKRGANGFRRRVFQRPAAE